MKIAIGQINPTLGDISGNVVKILDSAVQAKQQGADLVVLPELAITGYSPDDLLFRQEFIDNEQKALAEITGKIELPAIIGATATIDGELYNAAYFLNQGEAEIASLKSELPNYAVFDEKRYFKHDKNDARIIDFKGVKLGVLICEDGWEPEKTARLKAAGAEQIIHINASPYEAGKMTRRYNIVRQRCQESGLPFIYAHMNGGQDEMVFDGGSFVMNGNGELVANLPRFEAVTEIPSKIQTPLEDVEARYSAMCLGLRDYVHKNGFQKVLLGLSGGVDSAITAACAVDALGSENVRVVMMPSRFTSDESKEDAAALSKNLDIELEEIPIEPGVAALDEMLAKHFEGLDRDLTEENIQARLRGVSLMALSNKFNELLLTTGNKSELAVGYSTLYGDACGAFSVVKDLYKTQVYEICNWLNENSDKEIIPQNIMTKAPTAELRPNQTDQDSLPPYDIMDEVLKFVIEDRISKQEIIDKGYDQEIVEKTIKMLYLAQYKRFQHPPGVKLSACAFGRDWRYPVTNRFNNQSS